jgi:hypothetical protein
MDWFDKAAIGAVLALLVAFIAVRSDHPQEADSGRPRQPAATAAAANDPGVEAELEGKGTAVKSLMNSGGVSQAETLIRAMLLKFPYRGEPHMLMGDLLMRKQESALAVREYRQAVDLNPDYLDKKTPSFQGKKLKVAVDEALVELEQKLKQHPEDRTLRDEKKSVYLLYRKISGSCG